MFAYTSVECNYLETLAKSFIIPDRQTKIFPENIFDKAPACRIAPSMNKKSTFSGSFTENFFSYQQFGLGHFRILCGGQPGVDLILLIFVA